MSKLQELIQKLCPDGVDFRMLGEVCDILDSQREPISKAKRVAGNYPYYGANGIQDYVVDYIFDGTFLLVGEDGSVINKDNSPVLNWAVGKIWVNNHAHILAAKNLCNLRYIYYALQVQDVSKIVRGTPPKINQENLKNITIPFPPLEVQEEIVRILDNFTNLAAELQARQEQYEYYRNKLLTFNELNGVGYKKLGDFCEIKTGKGITKSDAVLGGTYPIISGGQSPMGYYHTFNREANTVTISRVGAYAGFVNYIKEQFYLNDKCFSVIPASERVSTLFLFYALKNMESKIKELQSEGGVPTINTTKVSNLEIPVPPIEVQEEIVRILDKFETLVNDLTEGLPAEIAAVQEQYEYYRDKLLSFPRNKISA